MMNLIGMVKNDRMLRNSTHLIAASAITSLLGFVFWIVCARIYPAQEVGIAASLISGMALVTTLTTLGFDYGMIKYRKLYSSCTAVAVAATIIVSAAFALATYGRLLDSMSAIAGFVIFSAAWTAFFLNDSIYIAMHRPKSVLFKQTVFAVLKLGLPFFFVSLGAYGIFMSWTAAAAISMSMALIYRPVQWSMQLDIMALRQMFSFSIMNYLSNCFAKTRELTLPLIITFYSGAAQTAYYFLSFNIALVFLLVPKQIAKAMLAEENIESRQIKKVLIITLLASISAVFLVFIAGKYLLMPYGTEYIQQSLMALKILAIAGVFSAVTEVYYGVMRSENRLKMLLGAQSANAAITLVLAFGLIGYGITGVAVAWLASEIITNAYIIYRFNPIKVILQ